MNLVAEIKALSGDATAPDAGLRNAACDAIRLAHGSRKYAKALRRVEAILLLGLGYTTFAEFARWEGER